MELAYTVVNRPGAQLDQNCFRHHSDLMWSLYAGGLFAPPVLVQKAIRGHDGYRRDLESQGARFLLAQGANCCHRVTKGDRMNMIPYISSI